MMLKSIGNLLKNLKPTTFYIADKDVNQLSREDATIMLVQGVLHITDVHSNSFLLAFIRSFVV